MSETTRQVLRMIHSGVINAEEAGRLLRALNGSRANAANASAAAPGSAVSPEAGALPGMTEYAGQPPADAGGPDAPLPDAREAIDLSGLRELWRIPFWASVVVMGAAAIGMGTNYNAYHAMTVTFLALWAVFLAALLVAVLSVWARTAPLIHVHVRDDDTDFRVALPLPVRFAAWSLRAARPFATSADLDALIGALDASALTRQPVHVEACGAGGERVSVSVLVA